MPLSKRKVTSADELSSADEAAAVPAKKPKTLKSTKGAAGGEETKLKRDDDGNAYWELTGRRRVVISEFRGNRMVSVREYYEKDGKELPGKKGISLPLDQFSALVSLLPQIEEQLQREGDKLSRPDYGSSKSGVEEAMTDEGATAAETTSKKKANHEETSDEEQSVESTG